jgi:GDP-L-fucose synthase
MAEGAHVGATDGTLDRGSRVYVAGHRGLAGSAIWRALAADGFDDVVGAASSEVDLRDRAAAFDYLLTARPDVVVLAAARVGGIVANDTYPAEFLSENLRIQVNVMDAAHSAGVRRLLFPRVSQFPGAVAGPWVAGTRR